MAQWFIALHSSRGIPGGPGSNLVGGIFFFHIII